MTDSSSWADPRKRTLVNKSRESIPEALPVPDEKQEPGEDYLIDCYSVISVDRQQKLMLELRFITGDARALAYCYLVGLSWNPSKGISMDFTDSRVEISGRNLRPVFTALCAHRIAAICEVDELHAKAAHQETKPVVTKIMVEKIK